MEKNIFNKINLFVLTTLGISTPEENSELKNQTEDHKNLQLLRNSLSSPAPYNERQEMLKTINTEEELSIFLKKHKKTPHRHIPWLWQAAAVMLLVASGTFWYVHNTTNRPASFSQSIQSIPPGTQGAVLVLSNGTTRQLQEKTNNIIETDGSRISSDSNHLNYTTISTTSDTTTIYNHLLVGRGFEYMLTLQDGTRVWMNSESELYYPVQFSSAVRTVRLSGEAYFEVAHDTTRPFTVEVNNQFEVKVLGTHFNIKAYPSDKYSETTLVKGKVAISSQKIPAPPVILKPSEQALLNDRQKIEIRQVNTSHYIAWHEGWFYFSNEQLEKALEQIGRWYDVYFIFDDPDIRTLMISGKIKRFENLDIILDMLSTTTGCNYTIDQKTVKVTKKNNRK